MGAGDRPGANGDRHFDQQHDAEQCSDRAGERFLGVELGQVVDIDQHEHEEQQHHHRAGVDDDLDHRQVLGSEHHEDPGDLDETDHQEDRGMHRVVHRHHSERGKDREASNQ